MAFFDCSVMTRGPRVRSPYSAVLRDRVAHVVHAALVDQVDDQLELVNALEIRHFGGVPGFGQGLEAGLDERGEPAAEHRLLAEEIGLGLFLERGLEDARAPAADGARVREPDLPRVTGRILVDGEEHRNAATARVFAANGVTGGLGGDEPHRDVAGRDDLLEMKAEPVRHGEVLAGVKAGRDFFLKISGASSSGTSVMMTSPQSAASATSLTVRPASTALPQEALSLRRPTATLTPLSFRLRAWACPWLP